MHRVNYVVSLLAPALLFAALAVSPSAAQTSPDWTRCTDSSNPDASLAACSTLINSGRESKAGLIAAYDYRGHAHYAKGQYDLAIADWDQAIRLDPKSASAYTNRGNTWRAKSQLDRAIADFTAAIKFDPKNAIAIGNRGEAYHQLNEFQKALADYRRLAALEPGNRDAAKAVTDIEAQLASKTTSNSQVSSAAPAADDRTVCFGKDIPSGIAACSRLIAAGGKPENLVSLYNHRAFHYYNSRDFDKAIADYSEAIRLNPKFALGYSSRAIMYQSKGDHDRTIADMTEALRLEPDKFADRYVARAKAFATKGELGRAIADFDKALELEPKRGAVYVQRAAVHEKAGNRDKALADYQAAIKLDSSNKFAADAVARLQPGDKAKASAALQSAPISNIFGPRVALVIGNGRYQHATVLPNPANDAADIAASLRKLGFEVIEGRDLDKRAMEDKVKEFSRKLDGAKIALFFYAGHGMQVGGRNYLIPVDGKLERPGDLSFETIDVTQVLAQMEAEQRVNLIFLDACRDNPLSRSFARTLGTRSTSVGQGLASIQSVVGTMIAYATQPDAVALDGSGRNSPFTTALLKHINTRGLEIGSMMRRVRADVVQVTNGKQVPWDHSSLLGDVILVQ